VRANTRRNRNFFSKTGINLTSVTAMAAALRVIAADKYAGIYTKSH